MDFKPKKIVDDESPQATEKAARRDGTYKELDELNRGWVDYHVKKRDEAIEKVGQAEKDIDDAFTEANKRKNGAIPDLFDIDIAKIEKKILNSFTGIDEGHDDYTVYTDGKGNMFEIIPGPCGPITRKVR